MVVVYSKEGCGPCRATKTIMEKKKISFEERLLDENVVNNLKENGIISNHAQAPIVTHVVNGKEELLWFGMKPDKIMGLAE